jgi:hypothetical protein
MPPKKTMSTPAHSEDHEVIDLNVSDGDRDSDGDLPVNKIRALVKRIRASRQRQEQFNNFILGGNQYGWWKDGQGKAMLIKLKQVLQDVRTRWDSTYQMLVRARELRQVSLLL